MAGHKIQTLRSLIDEMKAVARGDRKPPRDAGGVSFESVATLARLLTPENRRLLATIRDRKPQSVAALATMTGRAQPNVSRALLKLESAGLVAFTTVARRKVPRATVSRIRIEIDPFGELDRLSVG